MKIGTEGMIPFRNRTKEPSTKSANDGSKTEKPKVHPPRKPVTDSASSKESSEAVVVEIKSREPTEEEAANRTYSPEEVRSKARAFLNMGTLPPDQKQALERALTMQEMDAAKNKQK